MNRKQMIEEYLQAGKKLISVFAEIPHEAYDYLPALEDAWSIREHAVHLADSDINNFIRLKSCIAQPASNGFVIREEEWAERIREKKEDPGKYLQVVELLREIMASFLNTVTDEDFHSRYYIRDYNGKVEKITLAEAVEMYTFHIHIHLEYLERNLEEYYKKK